MEGFGCDPAKIVAKTRQVKSVKLVVSQCQSMELNVQRSQAGRQAGRQGTGEEGANR